MAIIILMQFTTNEHLYGYNQPEYCHAHYTNGTVLCHKIPTNMTMPVNMTMTMPTNMTMSVSHQK
ncbi:MAG TPA: hypothetical protein VI146_08010 [Nitrososphaeraceae archaeon]